MAYNLRKIRPIFKGFLGCILLAAIPAHAEDAQPELIRFYQYKPTYFLAGNPYEKIEFSFKVDVLREVPLFFGYTQLMMWDLFTASPYFYDINYNPEVFYRWAIPHQDDKWVDFGFYEHESNGKGGELERSWDRIYLRFHTRTRVGERSKLVWDMKAWAPIHYHVLSQDLAEYRGLWELDVSLADFLGPFFERGDLTLRVYPGGQSNLNPLHGGQELTFRTKSAPRAFLPLVILQLFHGYGETLLDYQMSRWGVRAGLGF